MILGTLWQGLSKAERRLFEDQAEADKLRYWQVLGASYDNLRIFPELLFVGGRTLQYASSSPRQNCSQVS
jgi:hypothetical protein